MTRESRVGKPNFSEGHPKSKGPRESGAELGGKRVFTMSGAKPGDYVALEREVDGVREELKGTLIAKVSKDGKRILALCVATQEVPFSQLISIRIIRHAVTGLTQNS
jgi:hypothetical protein